MMTVAEINELSGLSAFRSLWRELWEKTPEASFFTRLEWLESYSHRAPANQKLRILIASVSGRPIGIVPFVVKPVRTRLGQMRALTYPLDSWGAFYGPLGPHPAATMAAAMKHVKNSRRDWDLIDLRYVDTETADRGRTATAMRAAGFQSLCRQWRSMPAVEMHTSWKEHWACLPDLGKQEYLKAEKALLSQGKVAFERWRPDGAMTGDTDRRWDLFDACTGMLRLNEGTALRNAQGFALLRDTHCSAVDAGAADLCLLNVNHRTIGWAYSFHRDGCAEVVQVAVDPVLAEDAATVLIGRMLQDGFERGDRSVLFSPACAHLGQNWRNASRSSYRYTHFSLSRPRSQALHVNHSVKRWLNLDPAAASPVVKTNAVKVARKPAAARSGDPVILKFAK